VLVLVGYNGDGQFSIAGRLVGQADREVRVVDRAQAWVVVQGSLQGRGVRCIRRVRRRADQVVRGSVRGWARGRDSASGLDLGSGQAWVRLD
jgi:hypothetical protein